MLYYVLGSTPPPWGQGARDQGEQAGSEGSEPNVILDFRVPTTCGGKTLMITYSA